jgi:Domain of unknown function (DUF4280)
MPLLVVSGAKMTCSFGTAPATLGVLPTPERILIEQKPVASIADIAPMVNVPPFAMCITPSNPQVAAATAAALGVLTPQPCIPVIAGPWAPGAPTCLQGVVPSVTQTCKCMCAWGGVIQITDPGQAKAEVS